MLEFIHGSSLYIMSACVSAAKWQVPTSTMRTMSA